MPKRMPKTMEAALDRLTLDTHRLQFLIENDGEIMRHDGRWSVTVREPFIYVDKVDDLRVAIDRAIVEQKARRRLHKFPHGT